MARYIKKPTVYKVPKTIEGLIEYANRGIKMADLLKREKIDQYGEEWTFAEVIEVYNAVKDYKRKI